MPRSHDSTTGGRILRWSRLPDLPDPLGVAGPYVGSHRGAVVVAGGANFPTEPGGDRWVAPKVWLDRVWVLAPDDAGGRAWHAEHPLPRPMGYGATVSTPQGVVCIGGEDGRRIFADVVLLAWEPLARRLDRHHLPPLPMPLAFGAAATIGSAIYVVGGQHDLGRPPSEAVGYRLDLTGFEPGDQPRDWERLPDVPGGPRLVPVAVVRPDEAGPRLCVMSGRRTATTGVAETMEMLRDVHEFDPAAGCWRRLADMPAARMAGAAVAVSPTRVAVLAGDDGRLAAQTASLKDDHPGFSRTCLVYDADDDAWTTADETPTCQLATTLAPWEGGCVMVSGEIRPRARTPAAWLIETA